MQDFTTFEDFQKQKAEERAKERKIIKRYERAEFALGCSMLLCMLSLAAILIYKFATLIF